MIFPQILYRGAPGAMRRSASWNEGPADPQLALWAFLARKSSRACFAALQWLVLVHFDGARLPLYNPL